MTNIEIRINGAAAVKGKQDGLLTAGMAGATVGFSFDGLWDGLSKTAVFKCGGMVRDVIGVEDTARIPPEVLCPDTELYVGVEGRGVDGAVVIPTVWVRAAYVYPGANASGDPSTDPALPVWAQIQTMIGELAKLHTADKSSLAAAINELVATVGNLVGEIGGNNCGITYIESSSEDPVVLRNLESNTYVLKGKFLPYAGSTQALSFSSSLLVNINTQTAGTHAQVFYPVNNTVSFLSITDDSWERTDFKLNEMSEALSAAIDDVDGVTIQAVDNNVTVWNYSTVLPDLDTADINRVYAILNCLQDIQHVPDTTATSGTLLYYNGDTTRQDNTNKSFGVQILTATDHKTYLRSCWAGTWTEWGELSGKDDGRVIPNYANFSAFARFGTIGDSLSVGAYRQADGTDTYDEDKSWGEHIARNCHNERLSFGFGGATSTSWIQGVSWTDNGLEKALLPENQCDAYIIALGYNDNNTASSSGGVTLGSMADIDESDPDNNAVSYYGNMDKILRKLHGAFPNAKLFVLNNPYYNTDLAADYNVALSEITARLEGSNVYLIDMYGRYNSIYRELAADREGNHYHPQIYQYMGMLIATAISDYMLDNLAEFKYV